MKIHFYTHSTFSIKYKKINIIVDPFFTGNPLFYNQEKIIKNYLESIKIDYILITHAHFDHISDVEYLSKNTGAILISNYEIISYFEKIGIKNTISMNFGGFKNFNFGKIKYTWASHSSMFPNGDYGGNPGGFLLVFENKKNIYISGDTSLNQEMKLIPRFANLNLAILPIGGIFTMDIDEAIIASDLIKCNKILGVHYDTFKDIKINHEDSRKKFFSKGKELILLERDQELII